MPTVIYLHGFASSPHGTKARTIRQYVASVGADFRAPDLNVPTFEMLTVTAMIATTHECVTQAPSDPVYLVGSSLGAFVTLHYLDRHRHDSAQRVAKVLLLAPSIHNRWLQTPEYDEWQQLGTRPVQHFGYDGQIKHLHFGFMLDHQHYDSDRLQPTQPIHILHGAQDELIPISRSEAFVAKHPEITLQVLQTDHQMHDQLPTIWDTMQDFFGLG